MPDEAKPVSFARRLQLTAKSWQILNRPMLKHEQRMIASWASGFYSEGNTPYHSINLIGRGVDTLVPFLIEGDPKFLVETKVANYRPWALITQLALNQFISQLKLAKNVLTPVAFNSMFGAGITKTMLSHSANIVRGDEIIRTGNPSVTVISNSNYIGDPAAKRRQDFSVEGDVYMLPTEYAKDFFDKKINGGKGNIADFIRPDHKHFQEYSAEEITKPNYDRSKLGLRDQTTFIDLYIYDENIVVTIMPDGRKAKVLRTVEWKGPEGGPYDYLGYKFPPDTAVPLPPAWSWHDLDMTMNILFDKTREQAENQKKIIAYEASATKDARRVKDAPNMGAVRVDNIQGLKEIEYGGPSPMNFDWLNYAEQEFTKQGGSPDVLGGRGSQAPTLGQEQLVMSNATRIVRSFVTRWNDFVSSIGMKLAYDFWENPTSHMEVIREIPGYGQLPAVFTTPDRVGKFQDFVYNLVPYSMTSDSPEIKFQKLMQFMTSWVLPTMKMGQMQGNQIDVATATKILGEYLGFENLNQWYISSVPGQLDGIPYTMKSGREKKNPTQGADTFGATDPSRQANMGQQQERTTGSPQGNQGQGKE